MKENIILQIIDFILPNLQLNWSEKNSEALALNKRIQLIIGTLRIAHIYFFLCSTLLIRCNILLLGNKSFNKQLLLYAVYLHILTIN